MMRGEMVFIGVTLAGCSGSHWWLDQSLCMMIKIVKKVFVE